MDLDDLAESKGLMVSSVTIPKRFVTDYSWDGPDTQVLRRVAGISLGRVDDCLPVSAAIVDERYDGDRLVVGLENNWPDDLMNSPREQLYRYITYLVPEIPDDSHSGVG